jgi:hypothetical protein
VRQVFESRDDDGKPTRKVWGLPFPLKEDHIALSPEQLEDERSVLFFEEETLVPQGGRNVLMNVKYEIYTCTNSTIRYENGLTKAGILYHERQAAKKVGEEALEKKKKKGKRASIVKGHREPISTVNAGRSSGVYDFICRAYITWMRQNCRDYGVFAFHAEDLEERMGESGSIKGLQNDAPYELPADDLRPWARLEPDTSPETILALLVDRWGLDPPRVLVSVIGSGGDLELPPQLSKNLEKNFRTMAQSQTAWFATNGWGGDGIGKFVASSVEKAGGGVPVIGMPHWDGIQHNEILEDGDPNASCVVDGGVVILPEAGKSDDQQVRLELGLPELDPMMERQLDGDHTHFVIAPSQITTNDEGNVLNDQDAKFFSKTCLSDGVRQLELLLSNKDNVTTYGLFATESPVSVTCILIKGGCGQLKEVLERVDYRPKVKPTGGDENYSFAASGHHRTHTMVIKGTGGAADVIAYAYMMEDEGEGDAEGLVYEITNQLGIDAKHKALQTKAILMVKNNVK